MNLTGFSICADRPTVRLHILIHVFQTFLFPITCFKCLNVVPAVLVAGSERREYKNKEI